MINNINLTANSNTNFTYNQDIMNKWYNLPHIVKTEEVIG